MKKNEQNVILDSITERIFTIDLDLRIISFNRAAEDITGISHQQATVHFCKDILRANLCETNCALRKTTDTGEPVINKVVHEEDRKSISPILGI